MILTACATLLACGPPAEEGDAAIIIPDGGAPGVPELPTAPEPPAPPEAPSPPAWACPEGWRPGPDPLHDAAPCEPFPERLPEACEGPELHVPGTAGCARIGPACPTSGFGDAPTDAIFVDPAAAPDGDGRAASPFQTIADALAVAQDGDTIALAVGTFEEEVRLGERALTLVGACPEGTRIQPPALSDGQLAAVRVEGVDATLEDLTVSGASAGGHGVILGLDAPSTLEARGVVVEDVGIGFGVGASGSLTLRDTLVQRARDQAVRGQGGPVDADRVGLRDCASIGFNAAGARVEARRTIAERVGREAFRAEGDAAELVLDRVAAIEGRAGVISGLGGPRVTVRDALFRDGSFRGIDAEDGTQLTVERAHVDGATDAAIVILSGATGALSDVWVTRARRGTDAFGRALVVQRGEVEGDRLSFAEAGEIAIFVSAFSSGALRDLTVRRTIERNEAGNALQIAGASTLTLERALFEDSVDVGILVAQTETVLTARDVTVRGVAESGADGSHGVGLQVQQAGTAELERVRVEAAHSTGLAVQFLSRVTGVDVEVVDTDAPRNRDPLSTPQGRGIMVQEEGALELERVRLLGNREAGAYALGTGTRMTLRDVEVARTRSRHNHEFGRAVFAEAGGFVRLERAWIHDNAEAGIVVQASTAELFDVDVADIEGTVYQGRYGNGVIAQVGSRLVGARIRVRRAREAAILLIADTEAELTDVVVEDTRERLCAVNVCEGAGAGIGVGVYVDSSLQLTRFAVRRAALIGVQLARGGVIDLMDGEVSGCPIGANPQTEGFDVTRLTRRVRYVDNGRNLDAVSLPVPDVGPML